MRYLILAFMLIAFPLVASAQQKPVLRIMVEELDAEAIRCGITESAIESIAALTLRNNGILVSSKADPFLYVVINAMDIGNSRCVINLGVSVNVFRRQTPIGGFNSRSGVATIEFCRQSVVGHTSQSRGAIFVSQGLENQIKICLGNLEY